MLPIKTILFPTDFSPQSEYAFRLSCSLARDHDARLVVLHVAPPLLVYGEIVPPLPTDGYKDRIWDSFRKLQESEPGLRSLDVRTQLTEGDPVDEILRLAKQTDCDLIVMGTHGRTGLKRVLLGSVAELVLRKAPCPVLTVKSPWPTASQPLVNQEQPDAVMATPY